MNSKLRSHNMFVGMAYESKITDRMNSLNVLAEAKQRVNEIRKKKPTVIIKTKHGYVECTEGMADEYQARVTREKIDPTEGYDKFHNAQRTRLKDRNNRICELVEQGKTFDEIRVEMNLNLKDRTFIHILKRKD